MLSGHRVFQEGSRQNYHYFLRTNLQSCRSLKRRMMILSGGSIVISVLVGFATAAYFLYRYYQQNKRLPPMIKYSFMDFFHEFLRGQDHRFQLKMTREHGLIYRLPFPSLIPTVAIAVSDSALARLILEGNATHQEFEKSFRYKTLDGITNGVSTMLTKRSHGEGWDSSRKAVAPSFSNINLFRLLPQLQMKLNEFKSILDTHINEQKIFNDLSSWMVRLTIDFLAKTMFDVDFGTLNRYGMKNGTGKESLGSTFSDGQEYVELLSTVIKEVTLNQGLNPLRKYMFWNKEVIAATEGAREIQSIGLKVLNKYRREHTDDDLKVDKSIIAHLLRR